MQAKINLRLIGLCKNIY